MQTCLNVWCVIFTLPYMKKLKSAELQDLPISLLTLAHLSPLCLRSLWRTLAMCLSCTLHPSAVLEGWVCSLFISVLLCEITETDPSWLLSLPAFHVLFCMHLVPVRAESIIPPFDGSFVIILHQEQIVLLVCAFTLPGYWSYKLIKLIPVLISVAVYVLQPKLLSFNHSFSSISQPVLSPLQQLHLYNSQYPCNDLPEHPFPILPLVQTLFYGFLGYGHFFLCSEQKKRGSTKVLGMEVIVAEKREIIICITAAFT